MMDEKWIMDNENFKMKDEWLEKKNLSNPFERK
jgi:hypothetical protein